MSLFNKLPQQITISSEEKDVLEELHTQIKARKLKGIKVSSLYNSDDEWQFDINCTLAETVYAEEILPLLESSDDFRVCRAMLVFGDEASATRMCPQEILVSFELDPGHTSRYRDSLEFVKTLHLNILRDLSDKPAAVAYCIIDNVAVTVCIPCADPEALQKNIEALLKINTVKKYMFNIVERERA